MRTKLVCLSFFVTIWLFTGCKKCITCTESQTGYTTEYCGTSKQVKDFENELKSQGSTYGQTWNCIDK